MAGKLFHLGQSGTRGFARRGHARQGHRRIAVIARQTGGRGGPFGTGEGAERNQLALRVGNAQAQHVVGGHAIGCIGLHQNLKNAAFAIEIVGVGGPEGDRERGVHVGQREAQRAGLHPVDIDRDLGARALILGAQIGDQRALRRHAEQLVARRGQRLTPQPAAVLQFEREAARLTQRLNRGRLDHEGDRALDLAEHAHGLPQDLVRRAAIGGALVPRLERGEHQRIVLARSEEAEAAHDHEIFDLVARQPPVLDRLQRLVGPFLRRTGGRLDGRDQIALILGREEGGGQSREQQHGDEAECQKDGEGPPRSRQDAVVGATVFLLHPREPAIEPPEETGGSAASARQSAAPAGLRFGLFVGNRIFGVVVALLDGLQEGRTQSRRQRQGEKGGEEDRDRQRDRELAIDSARRSGKEGHRHEHRDQHQRDADDRPADLAHRLAGGLQRSKAFLAHDPFDILDHHDRIVDEDADRQHHSEQREHIDREAEQPQAETGARQRDRDDQRGDQRRAPVLEEQEHHEENERHRLDKRLDHLFDRSLDEGRGVVGDRPGDIARQARGELLHPLLDALRSGQRIGPGRQLDRHARHRPAVERRRCGIALRTDLDPRHLAEADDSRAGVRAQDDVLELLDAGEAPVGGDRRGDLLAVGSRLRADRTAGGLGVLFADRVEDRGGG